jgi:schlafen family protein
VPKKGEDGRMPDPVELKVQAADSLRLVDEFSSKELLARLRDTEDHLVERKSTGDKDWLPAAVAFANSVPIGYPAILFIGVKDDGTIEGKANFETLQQTFNRELNKAFPPIFYVPRVVQDEGKECLAVIIPGSSERPHFAGPSYVRVGAETRQASEQQFNVLIAERSSKTYEIRKWIGKSVMLKGWNARSSKWVRGPALAKVTDCNQFYVLVEHSSGAWTYPLSRVDIGFDRKNDMLELIVEELSTP